MADLYFDGDPAVDSPRRHMERVLKGEGSRRKWPFVLMALGGGGLWAIWKTAKGGHPAGDRSKALQGRPVDSSKALQGRPSTGKALQGRPIDR